MILQLSDILDEHLPQVGGKAKNLAWAMRQGWPVPTGFVVTVDGLGDVAAALAQLGAVQVAVRSSATEEDGLHASFAGQFDTVLNVSGVEQVQKAMQKVRSSAASERVLAYRKSTDAVPIAVIVQKMVDASVAGVLFTTDPEDVTEMHLVIEAAQGLGERVVSGAVTPDRFRLKKTDPTPMGIGCLSDSQLSQLVMLAAKIEASCGAPQDVEFAFDHDHLFLLQHRPITTITAKEREAIRQEIIAKLKADVAFGPWVRQNLADTLPAPTPMTWAVVQPMFTGTGALGKMNRSFGGTPDETLGDRSSYVLVASRVMQRPIIEMRLVHRDAPALRGKGGGLFAVLRAAWAAGRYGRGVVKAMLGFEAHFRAEVLPRFLHAIELPKLAELSSLQLVELFESIRKATTENFAAVAFQPAVFAEQVRQQLAQSVDDLALMRDLPIPPECSLPHGFAALAEGSLSEAEFLHQFGHRCHNEMELAQPRWSETGAPTVQPTTRSKPPANAPTAKEQQLRQYLALREEAKHDLIRGFAAMRAVLLELDTRFKLRHGIFYLIPTELPRLLAGDNLLSVLQSRQHRRRAELTLELPLYLEGNFEEIGRATQLHGSSHLQGVGLSAGIAEGTVLKLTEPTHHVFIGPTILVCPSTDPAWLPLLSQVGGAVMETGGTLSHGAIVCRELGVPAVAGIPNVMQLLKTGDRVRMDGRSGVIKILPEKPA